MRRRTQNAYTPDHPLSTGRGGGISDKDFTYEKLKAVLLDRNALFEDKSFPPTDSSIYFSEKLPFNVEWKRPTEICSDPVFIDARGASRFDVRQGKLGDCWLLAAVASLSLHSELFERVVPGDQSFQRGYCGMFRFHFWRFGEWCEVIVDDQLPTHKNRLVFMHSEEKSEFWSALLEKAYAKLCGSYEALKGGNQAEAMEDFTGGITEAFEINDKPPENLFDIMLKAQRRSCLLGCSIDVEGNEMEDKLPNGLIVGHAYSITDVRLIDVRGYDDYLPMVRCRNPWGTDAEWKGAWSDQSPEWGNISRSERESLGLTFAGDGEFWMSFYDFARNFHRVEICHLGPQSMCGYELRDTHRRRWEMSLEHGSWRKNFNAGGCRNFLDTFWTNPQFRVNVVDPDEDDNDQMGTIIVGLMQKNVRKRFREGATLHTIGYAIYRLEHENVGPLSQDFFKYNTTVAKSPSFVNVREICGRHKLRPGCYCIVPSTFKPGFDGEFILRIFSEKPNDSGVLDEVTQPIKRVKPLQSLPEDKKCRITAKEEFKRVSDANLEVDAYGLQNILQSTFQNDLKFDGFSIDTCRSLVAMLDLDYSGKLRFEEFKILWKDLRLWLTVFRKHDVDHSGNFNSFELRQALKTVGFNISNNVFNCLVKRYATPDGVIRFNDFIHICASLKTVFEIFKSQQKEDTGNASFSSDELVQCVMYS